MTLKPLAALVAGVAAAASVGVTVAVSSGTPAASSRSEGPSLGGGAVMPDGAAVQGPNGIPTANPGHTINVTGTVSGRLRPGVPATLTVTIGNKNNQDIVVTSVTGSITSVTTLALPGLPPCSAEWYRVGTSTAQVTIAKNKSGTVSVPVTLDDLATTNQDNCKGSTVQLSFTAQARQA